MLSGWPTEYLTSDPLPSGERSLRHPGYFSHTIRLPVWECLGQYDDPSKAELSIFMCPMCSHWEERAADALEQPLTSGSGAGVVFPSALSQFCHKAKLPLRGWRVSASHGTFTSSWSAFTPLTLWDLIFKSKSVFPIQRELIESESLGQQ